jgi:tetratricopeptide (TPR) repeat protein
MKAGIFALVSGVLVSLSLLACDNEAIRRNAEVLRQQEEELAVLRAEDQRRRGEAERDRREEQTYEACRDAFVSFERAQAAPSAREAETLYREGLSMCPDDDVAHYELGRILADAGRRGDARDEFETALNLNPNFTAAREELDRLNRAEGR